MVKNDDKNDEKNDEKNDDKNDDKNVFFFSAKCVSIWQCKWYKKVLLYKTFHWSVKGFIK